VERAADLSDGRPRWHAGGCHCGRVRFEVLAPPDLDILDCNCSMCSRSAYLHLIVEYRFGTGAAKHRFCRHCGVKSFYVPRSHPDGYSVNARCLDPSTISSMQIRSFDGRNWEIARSDLGAR